MSEAAVPHSDLGSKAGGLRLHSDDRLARRAARGEARAFERIYQRYHQDLYRFCLAMVGRPEDAQDALQNTMVKALRALPGETRQIKLKPWLYRIARNESVEILRRRRDNAELQPEHAVPDGEIADTAEARERLRRLLDDLGELPERQRAMLVMRELGGLDFAEIGAAFETSGSVARQTLYEARLSLRQMEAGREMGCDHVMRELSNSDGRLFRRRDIRAHLRACADCRAFSDAIGRRQDELAAIAPLPLAASVGLLHGILGGGTGGSAAAAGATAGGAAGGGGGLIGSVGAGTGKVVAGSALAKSVATVAVVAAVGVGAADRTGLIDVPLAPGGSSGESARSHPAGHGSAPGSASAAHRASAAKSGQGAGSADGRTAAPGSQAGSGASAGGHARANGGGHSPSTAHHHGRGSAHSPSTHGSPGELPAASNHGQETAAAHKAPQANPTPTTPRGESHAPPPAPAHPAPKPKATPDIEEATAEPPATTTPERPEKGSTEPQITEEGGSRHSEG